MPKSRDHLTPPAVPDEVAKRVIARAIELDTDASTQTPVATLREIALEAGVSQLSFERALAESLHAAERHNVTPVRMGYFRRLGGRLLWGQKAVAREIEIDVLTLRGAFEAAVTNLLAFAMFWVPALLINSFMHSIGYFRAGAWSTGLVLACTLAGIGLAIRMRARAAASILGIAAIAMAMEITSALSSGRLGSTAFSMMTAIAIAMAVGVIVGRRIRRKSDPEINSAEKLHPLGDTKLDSPPRHFGDDQNHFLKLGLTKV